MKFDSIEILRNMWAFAAVWVACLIAAGILFNKQKQAPATLLVLPILAAFHFGGWFDLRLLLTREGIPYWLGLLGWIAFCLWYAVVHGRTKIAVNVEKRQVAQEEWFDDHDLDYDPEHLVVPKHLQSEYTEFISHTEIFKEKYVEAWYSNHKMEIFWVVYFCPVVVAINVFETHLRQLMEWILGWKILRVPFNWISDYHFDEWDLKFREIARPAVRE